MRINIYSQELTKEVEMVSKVASDTGIRYYGIRIYLASPDVLHHTEDDDDRSAVTFWIPQAERFNAGDLGAILYRMACMAHNRHDQERQEKMGAAFAKRAEIDQSDK